MWASRLLCVAFALAPVTAHAETLDQVIERHAAARGGLSRIKALQSLRMTGTARSGQGRTALVTRELKRPGRMRMEFAFQGMTGVYVWDGQRGFQVSPLDGSLDAQPLSSENLTLATEQSDIEGPLVDWRAKGHTVELSGRERAEGRELIKLKVTLKSGAVTYHYLDARSHLLARMEGTRMVRGHEVVLETRYDDYRTVGGLRFPYRIETGAKGRPRRLSVVVDKVELDPKIDDARFVVPESLATP